MLFDTGSAVIYAISDKCLKDDCPEKMEKYDTRSKSLRSQGDRQELNYGQGYVSGQVGFEKMCFDGTGKNCASQVQMLVGDQGSRLEADKFSGIVGLSPQNDPNNKLKSFIEQVTQTKEVTPIFSFYLPKNKDGKLVIGGYDLDEYAKGSEVVWSDVPSDEKTWSVTYNGVGFKDGPSIGSKSERIMLDTGLTYALVPVDDVKAVSKALAGYSLTCQEPQFTGKLGLYQCSQCHDGNFKSLAPIQLSIGGKYFEMPVDSYIKRMEGEDNEDKCQLLLHPYETSYGSDSKWVLGAQFLQKYYSIYDFQRRRIGLVEAKP